MTKSTRLGPGTQSSSRPQRAAPQTSASSSSPSVNGWKRWTFLSKPSVIPSRSYQVDWLIIGMISGDGSGQHDAFTPLAASTGDLFVHLLSIYFFFVFIFLHGTISVFTSNSNSRNIRLSGDVVMLRHEYSVLIMACSHIL